MSLTVSVLVPSYRRPDDLRRCLGALACQARAADEIIIVVRDDDMETRALLRGYDSMSLPPLKIVTTAVPGVVNALNVGLHVVNADVVAITDDDAAPAPEWLERIAAYFQENEQLGGVGGRDRMFIGGKLLDGKKRTVGKVPAVGRHVGNHHLGFGPPREVDVLKGVNCAYRSVVLKEIGFDTRMRGTGAQVNWELSLGRAVKRAGWKLVYDPHITVDHFPAKRFDEDQRDAFNAVALENAAYNEMVARMDERSRWLAAALIVWAILVGTRDTPGLIQWLRFLPSQKTLATRMFLAAVRGRLNAWIDYEPRRGTAAGGRVLAK